jgi:hypothetical protein
VIYYPVIYYSHAVCYLHQYHNLVLYLVNAYRHYACYVKEDKDQRKRDVAVAARRQRLAPQEGSIRRVQGVDGTLLVFGEGLAPYWRQATT